MPESVPVRCPACRREHVCTAPSYPCACGAPVAPSLDRRAAPAPVAHRVWDEDWITVRCGSCGRRDQWPRPELGCACGTFLWIPLREAAPAAESARAESVPAAPAPPPRPALRPVTIRTARDVVTAAALYLRWLGYEDIRRCDQRPPAGVGLAARGLLAQVDPAVWPASPRDVECLWLTAMAESAGCAYFSLAGYTDEARGSAGALGVPLFVLDLTGTPQPVNEPAHALHSTGA
ncbi:hypothetical protein [Streptomyces sp. NPDC086766]|uniref:hypothetical protein n=1 Tax=Streptomyces sp. NPDC086766 TaxID=3365754 RepID=UPI0037F8ED26